MNPQMFESLFEDVYSYNWDLSCGPTREFDDPFDVNIYSQQTKRPVDWSLNLKKHPRSFKNALIFPFYEDLSVDHLNIRLTPNQYIRRKTKRNFKVVKASSKASKAQSSVYSTSKNPSYFSSSESRSDFRSSEESPSKHSASLIRRQEGYFLRSQRLLPGPEPSRPPADVLQCPQPPDRLVRLSRKALLDPHLSKLLVL